MLTDAIDGALTPEQQARFDMHLLGCVDCALSYEDAQRGAAWLEMLKSDRPEPTVDLMARILEQTSGPAYAQQPAYIANVVPINQPVAARWSTKLGSLFHPKGIGQVFLQPRLAMTAAMAFFSIALTLNLTGVHLSELKASDLTPGSLKRSFYQTNARVIRYYDNLRVVYELESRVREIRQNDDTPAQQPQQNNQQNQKQNDQKDVKRPRNGSSRKESLRPNYLLVGQVDKQFLNQNTATLVASLNGKPERGLA
jgi:hypothetical protein